MMENAVCAISNVGFRRAAGIDPPDRTTNVAMFETRRVQYRELMQMPHELLPHRCTRLTRNVDA